MTTEYEAVLKSDQLRSQYDLFLGVRLCLKYKSLIKKTEIENTAVFIVAFRCDVMALVHRSWERSCCEPRQCFLLTYSTGATCLLFTFGSLLAYV